MTSNIVMSLYKTDGKSRRTAERGENNCTNCTNKIKNKKTIDNSSRRMV